MRRRLSEMSLPILAGEDANYQDVILVDDIDNDMGADEVHSDWGHIFLAFARGQRVGGDELKCLDKRRMVTRRLTLAELTHPRTRIFDDVVVGTLRQTISHHESATPARRRAKRRSSSGVRVLTPLSIPSAVNR